MKRARFHATVLAGFLMSACVIAIWVSPAHAVIFFENFESYTGSAFPGTELSPQSTWQDEPNTYTQTSDRVLTTSAYSTPNFFSGNTLYNDGTFNHPGPDNPNNDMKVYKDVGTIVGPGHTDMTLIFDGRVGNTRWSRFGLGYFDAADTGNNAFRYGVLFGSFDGSGWGIETPGSGTVTSTTSFPSELVGVRMKLEIDLTAVGGSGSFAYDLNDGNGFQSVAALQNVNLGFNTLATDQTNPLNWNSLYVRNIGPGDAVDNLFVEVEPVPEPAAISLLVFGLVGLGLHRWRKRNR